MPELRELLDWAVEPVAATPDALESAIERARRRARRQRYLAAAVAIAVAVTGIGLGLGLVRLDGRGPVTTPAPTASNRPSSGTPQRVVIPAPLPASAVVPADWFATTGVPSESERYLAFAASTRHQALPAPDGPTSEGDAVQVAALAPGDAFVEVFVQPVTSTPPGSFKLLVPFLDPDRNATAPGEQVHGEDVLALGPAVGRDQALYTVVFWVGPDASPVVRGHASELVRTLVLPWADVSANASVTRQAVVRTFGDEGVRLDPPPADLDPEIAAEEILRRAYWSYNPFPDEAITATFALYTSDLNGPLGSTPRYEELPVWVVRFVRNCRPNETTTSSEQVCTNDFHVAYDAATGEWLGAWQRGPGAG